MLAHLLLDDQYVSFVSRLGLNLIRQRGNLDSTFDGQYWNKEAERSLPDMEAWRKTLDQKIVTRLKYGLCSLLDLIYTIVYLSN